MKFFKRPTHNSKKWLNSIGFVALAVLLMGNQKCQQQPAQTRQLKKNVKVLKMEASSFLDNSGFKFSEVAQNQLSGVLFETSEFYERNIYPTTQSLLVPPPFTVGTPIGQKTTSVVAEKSMVQLKTWFPTLKAAEVLLSQDSSCLVSKPQHFLYGKINALEAYSGMNLQFGFNPSVVQVPLNAKFKMDKMRMDLSFHAYDPWTYQEMAATNSEVFKKDYSAGFGIDLGIIHIGPEFYRVTGMAEVTLSGLKKAVSDIAKKLLSIQRQEWQTRVLLSRDNYVAIVGGAELGLKKGDRLKIENEVHNWMGEPCGETGQLVGSVVVTQEPWIVEIEDAGNMMSKAKVLNPRENETIEVGALTRVSQFVEDIKSQDSTGNKKP